MSLFAVRLVGFGESLGPAPHFQVIWGGCESLPPRRSRGRLCGRICFLCFLLHQWADKVEILFSGPIWTHEVASDVSVRGNDKVVVAGPDVNLIQSQPAHCSQSLSSPCRNQTHTAQPILHCPPSLMPQIHLTPPRPSPNHHHGRMS